MRMDAVQPRRPDVLHRGHSARHSERRQSRETCDTRASAAAVCMAQGTIRPGGGGGPHEYLGANRRAARARPELKRERGSGVWELALALLCAATANGRRLHLQRLRSHTSCHPHHRTQRSLRTRTGTEYPSPPPPSHPPPPSPRPDCTWAAPRRQHWIDRPADSAFTFLGPRDKGQG